MAVTLSLPYFSFTPGEALSPRTQFSYFPATSSILFWILSSPFSLSGCLSCAGVHQRASWLTTLVSLVTSPWSPSLEKIAQADRTLERFSSRCHPAFWSLSHRSRLIFLSQLFEIYLPVIYCAQFVAPHCHPSQRSQHFHSAKWCLFVGENLSEQVSDPDHFLHPMED